MQGELWDKGRDEVDRNMSWVYGIPSVPPHCPAPYWPAQVPDMHWGAVQLPWGRKLYSDGSGYDCETPECAHSGGRTGGF